MIKVFRLTFTITPQNSMSCIMDVCCYKIWYPQFRNLAVKEAIFRRAPLMMDLIRSSRAVGHDFKWVVGIKICITNKISFDGSSSIVSWNCSYPELLKYRTRILENHYFPNHHHPQLGNIFSKKWFPKTPWIKKPEALSTWAVLICEVSCQYRFRYPKI